MVLKALYQLSFVVFLCTIHATWALSYPEISGVTGSGSKGLIRSIEAQSRNLEVRSGPQKIGIFFNGASPTGLIHPAERPNGLAARKVFFNEKTPLGKIGVVSEEADLNSVGAGASED